MRLFLPLSIIAVIILISIISFETSSTEEVADVIEEEIIDNNFSVIPHKSLYEIKLVSKQSSSDITNISGKMFFEWGISCEGWITDHRFNLNYEYTDAPTMGIISDFNTYESFDGKILEYSSKRIKDGLILQNIRGTAYRNEDNTGIAKFVNPENLAYKLPKDFYFPMKHTVKILEKLENGNKFFKADVFDGSDDKGPIEINSFIGNEVNAISLLSPTPDIDTNLVNNKAWNVRMAFFSVAKSEEEASDYEMSIILHENGVISNVLIEYSDFTIEQRLIALEKLEPDKCNN